VALGRAVEGDDAEVREDPPAPERELRLLALGVRDLRVGGRARRLAAAAGADRRARDRGDGSERAKGDEATTPIDVG
jgi:hypothetical protein